MDPDVRYDPFVPPAQSVKKARKRKHRIKTRKVWHDRIRALPCHYCGGPGGTIDHVIPRSRGGWTTPENCIPACEPCNKFRGNRPYKEFKEAGWKERRFR